MIRWLAILALSVAGCRLLPDVEQRIEHAAAKARAQGFTAEHVEAGPFTLQAFHRWLDRNIGHWHVYLEGEPAQ